MAVCMAWVVGCKEMVLSLDSLVRAFGFWKLNVCALAVLVLPACGGSSFEPSVTGVQTLVLQYGRTATIEVGGVDLRNTLQADLGTGCASPVFSSASTPSLAILNCTVTAVGDLPLTIRSADGKLLYQTILNVPNPQVRLSTSKGNIVIELEPQKAPLSVNNFLDYVRSGFYASTIFHRVIAGFVVQGGGFTNGMALKTGLKNPIALESNNGLSNLRGTVAMARTQANDSATSQFFVNLVDNSQLDYKGVGSPGYAVFGRVVQGLDVVDAIAKEPTGTVGGYVDVPLADVTITQVTQIK